MIVSTGVGPNDIFVSYLKTSKTRFCSRGYFLLAGVGPNDCSVFIESHHYNFVTNHSKHDFVDRRWSKPFFLMSFFVDFLIFLIHFWRDKHKLAQEPPKSHQEPPKSRPRAAQSRPRAAKSRPRAVQEPPRGLQEQPKSCHKPPRAIQKQPKSYPRAVFSCPRGAKMVPKTM